MTQGVFNWGLQDWAIFLIAGPIIWYACFKLGHWYLRSEMKASKPEWYK